MSAALVLLVALPLLGAAVIAAAPFRERAAAVAGVAVTAATFAASLAVLGGFDYGDPGRMQMQVHGTWVPALDASFHLGVDGMSLPLVVLTALLSFLCAVYTLVRPPHGGGLRALTALLLLLEVGMLGTFLALDLVLFFVFFEVVLIPMYFLIAAGAVSGGGARRRSSSSTRCSARR